MLYEIDPEFEHEEFTEELHEYIWVRDDMLCVHCSKGGAEIHHIQFRSQGGGHKANNLCLLCDPCHNRMHSDKPIPDEKLIKRVRKNEKRFRKNLV